MRDPRRPAWHPLAEDKQPGTPKPKKSKKPKHAVQRLIMSRKVFNKTKARAWARKHGFSYNRCEESDRGFRLIQRPLSDFVRGSMYSISIGQNVKARMGRLKSR